MHARPRRWPRGRDWSAVTALGLLFIAVFFGVAAVFAGIWIASTTGHRAR